MVMHGLQTVAALVMKGGFFPAPFLFKEIVKNWKKGQWDYFGSQLSGRVAELNPKWQHQIFSIYQDHFQRVRLLIMIIH